MSFEFVPLDECMLCYPNGSRLVGLITPELLIDPRMCVGCESQATLRLPLFNGTNETLYAVLASIAEMLPMFDDLTNFPDEGEIVANHGIKAIVLHDAVRPCLMQ